MSRAMMRDLLGVTVPLLLGFALISILIGVMRQGEDFGSARTFAAKCRDSGGTVAEGFEPGRRGLSLWCTRNGEVLGKLQGPPK